MTFIVKVIIGIYYIIKTGIYIVFLYRLSFPFRTREFHEDGKGFGIFES